MLELTNFLSTLGRESVRAFWFPMAIWTLFAFILMALLWKKDTISSSYQFHGRMALLVALPLGIIGSAVVTWWTSLSESAGGGATFIVMQSPITISAAESTSGMASIVWNDPFLWVGLLLSILIAGSLLSMGYLFWNLLQLRSLSKRLHFAPLHKVFEKGVTIPDSGQNSQISFSGEVNVPFTYGCFQTRIVLPESLRSDRQDTLMAVKHELIHVKHRDFLINNILSFIKCLFWFHPITHKLYNSCKEFREITCDREVLSDTDVSKKDYARLLYKIATQPKNNNPAIISMAVNSSTLKKRIKMMTNQSNTILSYKRSIMLMSLAAFFIVGVMSCSDLQNDSNTNSEISQDPTVQTPPPPPESSNTNTNSTNQKKQSTESPPAPVSVAVEDMPELKGGLAALQQNITYPEQAREAGHEGRVIVQFIVSEQGQVQDPQIVKGVSESLDQEALRVVKQAEFTPGMQKNQPVRVQYSLPITFQLAAEDE